MPISSHESFSFSLLGSTNLAHSGMTNSLGDLGLPVQDWGQKSEQKKCPENGGKAKKKNSLLAKGGHLLEERSSLGVSYINMSKGTGFKHMGGKYFPLGTETHEYCNYSNM